MVEQPDYHIEKDLARGYFRRFLEGKRSLGWAVSTISSKLYGQPLKDLLAEFEMEVGDGDQYQELRKALDKLGYLDPEAGNKDKPSSG